MQFTFKAKVQPVGREVFAQFGPKIFSTADAEVKQQVFNAWCSQCAGGGWLVETDAYPEMLVTCDGERRILSVADVARGEA